MINAYVSIYKFKKIEGVLIMDVSQETNQTVADTKTEAVAVEEKRHFNRQHSS